MPTSQGVISGQPATADVLAVVVPGWVGIEYPTHSPGKSSASNDDVLLEGDAMRAIMADDYYPYAYPVPSEYVNDFMAPDDDKWRVLESIGIERKNDTTPLCAWRDAVAVESGVTEGFDPGQGRPLDLGFSPAYVRRFVFYLA